MVTKYLLKQQAPTSRQTSEPTEIRGVGGYCVFKWILRRNLKTLPIYDINLVWSHFHNIFVVLQYRRVNLPKYGLPLPLVLPALNYTHTWEKVDFIYTWPWPFFLSIVALDLFFFTVWHPIVFDFYNFPRYFLVINSRWLKIHKTLCVIPKVQNSDAPSLKTC